MYIVAPTCALIAVGNGILMFSWLLSTRVVSVLSSSAQVDILEINKSFIFFFFKYSENIWENGFLMRLWLCVLVVPTLSFEKIQLGTVSLEV